MEQEMQQLRALARQQAEKVAAEKAEKEALNKRLEQAEREKEAAVAARKAMEAEIEREHQAAAGKYIKVGVIVWSCFDLDLLPRRCFSW